MFSRVTQLEIDTVGPASMTRWALRDEVLPRLRTQPGYEGVYVLATAEGKGMILSCGTPRTPRPMPNRASTPTCSRGS